MSGARDAERKRIKREYDKLYRAANKEYRAEQTREYCRLNKEMIAKRGREGRKKIKVRMREVKACAKQRDILFTLTDEQTKALLIGECHYCYSSYPSSPVCIGIDRVDNDVGYTSENCVTCCWTCNSMKGKLSVEQFMRHLMRIAHHNDFLASTIPEPVVSPADVLPHRV